MSHAQPQVPLAQPGPITDQTLSSIIQIAQEAQEGRCTHDGGTLLLMTAAPLLRELLARRQAMARIGEMADMAIAANVVKLFPGEAAE